MQVGLGGSAPRLRVGLGSGIEASNNDGGQWPNEMMKRTIRAKKPREWDGSM